MVLREQKRQSRNEEKENESLHPTSLSKCTSYVNLDSMFRSIDDMKKSARSANQRSSRSFDDNQQIKEVHPVTRAKNKPNKTVDMTLSEQPIDAATYKALCKLIKKQSQ